MLILGINTASKTASTAVMDSENFKILAEMKTNGRLSHSESLMPMIDATLQCAGVALCEIELFAVAEGPGSFTGIRIGIATTKGLAFGSSLVNCVGVSSLCALAYNFYGFYGYDEHSDLLILPAIDARRKQVYNAIFENLEKLECIRPDRIITTGELEEELNLEFAGRKIAFVGDGAKLCQSEINFSGIIVQIPEMLHLPSAASVCRAAYEEYKKSGAAHPRELAPAYLIKTQAEREYDENKQ
ncbi:MAG: tRNA (adenosine(37)-N6)-threonylcarbamoyltransferase complex dimerization subunit type 1 TsaB [Oscillospiraceae bacterium]|nr:tRNA (adenosine(37)-N6)-threonylcarbamoyltransferase complex dimerization subunit type 1 TsaB [Oscillospiraceae bacterium]